jgi:methionyl-tRNA formyltransferase
MRVVFMGDKRRGIVCLDAVLDRGDEVVGVVAPSDKKIADWYPSIAVHARDRELPVIQPADINASDTISQLKAWDPDVMVMAGYSQILSSEILLIPSQGVLNLHGGKLPEYRGGSTLNWMLIEGEREGGIAVLFAEEGIDTGDVVVKETFPIEPNDTILDVIETTNELFPEMLVTALDRIDSEELDPTPQIRTEGAYYHSRRPQHGEIHWREMSAERVHNLVRALAGPYPSAFTQLDGEKLRIERTSRLDETVRGVPGRVCLRRDSGVVVVAADRGLLVERIAAADGESQDANAFFDSIGVDLG